jgi:hypothetical protein
MAIQATLETDAGESRPLYVRINSMEGLNNHGAECFVRFRGYISQAAFEARKAYVWERVMPLTPDVARNIWEQAYDTLKAKLADEANPMDAVVSGAVVDVLEP